MTRNPPRSNRACIPPDYYNEKMAVLPVAQRAARHGLRRRAEQSRNRSSPADRTTPKRRNAPLIAEPDKPPTAPFLADPDEESRNSSRRHRITRHPKAVAPHRLHENQSRDEAALPVRASTWRNRCQAQSLRVW